MIMRATNLTKIYQKYKGQWVALKGPNEKLVIASGKTLKETLEKAHTKGIVAPLMTQIPEKLLPLVGSPKLTE